MKLASLKTGGRDGSLIVVSRDLKHYVSGADISPTLQTALDDWQQAAPRLNARYAELNRNPVTVFMSWMSNYLLLHCPEPMNSLTVAHICHT